MRVRAFLLAASLLAPAAASAALLQITFEATIVGYSGNVPDDPLFQGALPLGTAVEASVTLDDAVFQTGGSRPASGTVAVGGVSYAATSAGSNGGIGPINGQVYSFLYVGLSGPIIPGGPPGDGLGRLGLSLGVPYPDPLAPIAGLEAYPYNSLSVVYDFEQGSGFYFNRASLAVETAAITAVPTAVPEPGSAALLLAGLAGLAAARAQRTPNGGASRA